MSEDVKLCPQIQAHWTGKQAPLDHSGSQFDYTKMANCQRMNIGFRPESLDVLIKFDGEDSFLAADPETIYRMVGNIYTKESPEMQKITINKSECIIKIELDSINLRGKEVFCFGIKNTSKRMEDIKIVSLSENEIKNCI